MRSIPWAELPGLTALMRDYVRHQGRAAGFFAVDFDDRSQWQTLAERVTAAGHADRRQLVDILRDQNRGFGAGPATWAHLDRLQDPQALAIVTGQQAGLFGGPLYTLYKVLAVCRMAADLSAAWNRPVLPVFYLVSEDHDLEEIKWAGYLDRSHQFNKLVYEPVQAGARMPASQVTLDDTIRTAQEHLAEALPFGAFQAEIFAALAQDYCPGETLVTAFARWSLRLLGEYGLIILDASDERLKRLMAPIFRRELEENLSIPAMLKTNHRLAAAGYHAQMTVQPQRPHLFRLDEGRHSIERARDGFINLHDQSGLSLPELLGQPERLSPKAALRPLVQDWLLPTLAYVGGPGEIAYWAQLQGVYEAFGRPMPVVMPRPGMTLLEQRAEKWLQKYAVDAETYITDREAVEARLRLSGMPAEVTEAMAAVRAPISRHWPALQQAVEHVDATLAAPAEKTGAGIMHALAQLEGKVLRAVEQKEKSRAAHLNVLQQSIWPGGQLQERQLNVVPFLCQYGWTLIERLYDEIAWQTAQHHILVLSGANE